MMRRFCPPRENTYARKKGLPWLLLAACLKKRRFMLFASLFTSGGKQRDLFFAIELDRSRSAPSRSEVIHICCGLHLEQLAQVEKSKAGFGSAQRTGARLALSQAGTTGLNAPACHRSNGPLTLTAATIAALIKGSLKKIMGGGSLYIRTHRAFNLQNEGLKNYRESADLPDI